MGVVVDPAWAFSLLLVAARVATVFFLTPLDALGRMPARVKVVYTLLVAALMAYWLDLSTPMPGSVAEMTRLLATEIVLGLALVFGVYGVMAVFQVAGRLMDYQTGFGAAGIFNPSMGETAPLFGTFLSLLFVVLFMNAGGHLLLLEALMGYFRLAPPGVSLSLLQPAAIIAAFGYVFSAGFTLALPVVMTLLVLDLGIGVMSRSMPQMNVYFLFLPLKILVGLFMAWLMVDIMQSVTAVQIEWLQSYWTDLVGV